MSRLAWMMACSVSTGALAGGQNLTLVVELPLEAQEAKGRILADQYTYTLVVRPVPETLQHTINEAAVQLRARVTPLPKNGAEIRLRAQHPLQADAIKREGGRLRVTLTYQMARTALRSRLQQRSPSFLPTPSVAAQFAPAEQAIVEGAYEHAVYLLEQLGEEYADRPWALMRMGDVAFLQDSVSAACAQYKVVEEGFSSRTAGIVANLRRHVLGCHERATTATQWRQLFEHTLHLPGPLGDYLREQTAWALRWSADYADQVDALASLLRIPERHRRIAVPGVVSFLLARAIRNAPSPVDAVTIARRYPDIVRQHEEASDLLLEIARNLVDLDLVHDDFSGFDSLFSIKNRYADNGAWKQQQGDAQLMQLLGTVYAARNDVSTLEKLHDRYFAQFREPLPETRIVLPPLPAPALLTDLAAVEARLTLIDEVMNAKGGSP